MCKLPTRGRLGHGARPPCKHGRGRTLARNCAHFKSVETLDGLHQARARQKPARTAKQKRLAQQAVGQTTGRLIRAKREAQRAPWSNDPAKLSQCQKGIRYGFQCPDTGHKIERAVAKRQRLQSSLYLWHRNVGAARKHGCRRVEQGHQMRRHALGNQSTCQFAGAAARIQQFRIRRGERTHQGFQRGLRLAACVQFGSVQLGALVQSSACQNAPAPEAVAICTIGRHMMKRAPCFWDLPEITGDSVRKWWRRLA